jgi:predicted membrane protein
VSSALGEESLTPRMHALSLLVGMSIMIGGSLYPLFMANAAGRADHVLATLLFWAMSAGFVRGIGFVPRYAIPRRLLSGWACATALAMAGVVKLLH